MGCLQLSEKKSYNFVKMYAKASLWTLFEVDVVLHNIHYAYNKQGAAKLCSVGISIISMYIS
jgi:hypothetical protein